MKGLIFCISCGAGYHEDYVTWIGGEPFCPKCEGLGKWNRKKD
jgi:hypothetical protein